ncbi:receptor-type tyrosine-protein phosphatase H-like isoform X2 [Zootermopsis nevadensis]|uniref:receptor-type tyrosine-protein phosphatase H-like isoform X2 n=1 Tax=Zootermopsis nevadensis TaxID=136037 RepID=UPI000B8EB75A|nr:receptor-type tyrosine-protein phosphatase H-like isoform X2 [Zootermopsis nevadensis]
MFPASVSFCFSLLICSTSFTTPSNYLTGSSDTEDEFNSEPTIPYADSTTDITSGISHVSVNETLSTEVSTNRELTAASLCSVPGKVQELTLVPSSHNISLTWKKPIIDGNCVELYVISWKPNISGNSASKNVTSEEFFVIDGLDACVEYEVSVTAVNANNGSSEAEVQNITTVVDVPGKVEELTLVPSSHNISLTWKKPIIDVNCVKLYVISWKPNINGNTASKNVTSEEFFVIDGLDACVEYEVSVTAVNANNGSSEAEVQNITTVVDVPGKVEELTLVPSSHNISLTWKKPIIDGNCVKHYVISWKHNINGNSASKNVTSEEFFVIDGLDACVEYEVSVRAMNDRDENTAAVKNVGTEIDVPGEVQNLLVEQTSHNLTVTWLKPGVNRYCVKNYYLEWKDTADDSSNTRQEISTEVYNIPDLSACVEYEVSVSAVNSQNYMSKPVNRLSTTNGEVTGAPEYNDTLCLETEMVCLKWALPDLSFNRCQLQNCTVVCIAVDMPGLPVRNGASEEFLNDSVIVNVVELSPSTSYSCVAYITNQWGSSRNSSIIYLTTEEDVPVGMIVGVLFAIIVVGLLAVVFVTYRQGTLVWPPKFFARAKQVTVRPQPILLKKFPAYCAQMLDTPTRIGSEYQLLATLSVDISASSSCLNGQIPENRRKNRYINILPYDSTRVTLDMIDGDPTSHYINASFIKGYSNDIEYIATQGPKEDTCVDFWRMVFQHDVRVIVMVTNLIEQDKVKCHQYYPNLRESVVFGDMTIRCTTEIKFTIHTARTLVLIKGDRKRTLSHLHFREWPDFGVPQSTDIMIQFCQTMRHHACAAELGLILVHCSAGVGRTGTLIAVDILLQHICENKKVDIFGTVFKLRKQRTNMVQTEGQYTYIYRCIKDAIEDPTIVNQGTVINNSLEPIYENVGTSLSTLQYEKLPKWSKKDGEA